MYNSWIKNTTSIPFFNSLKDTIILPGTKPFIPGSGTCALKMIVPSSKMIKNSFFLFFFYFIKKVTRKIRQKTLRNFFHIFNFFRMKKKILSYFTFLTFMNFFLEIFLEAVMVRQTNNQILYASS